MNITDPGIQHDFGEGRRSAVERYRDLVIGRAGWVPLLRHEFVHLFCGTPGALGLFLRARLYPRLLGACGRNVVFGRNVILRHPHKIRIGDNVVIDDNCLLDAKGRNNRGITIGNRVFVGRNSILSCKDGDIELGDHVNIGFNCEIVSSATVTLGRNSMAAAYCYIIGADHRHDDPNVPICEQPRCARGIAIGEDTWCGAGARILDGTTLGSHAIIGANAVVTRAVPDYAVAVGIPARVVRDRRTVRSAATP